MTFPVENTCLKFIWIVLKSNDVQENQLFILKEQAPYNWLKHQISFQRLEYVLHLN